VQVLPTLEPLGVDVLAPAEVFERLLDVPAADPERLISNAEVIRPLPIRLIVQMPSYRTCPGATGRR
jgi:hypothetical protein